MYCSSELQAPFFTSDKLFRLYSLKYICPDFVWYSRKFQISLALFTWKAMQIRSTFLPTFLLIFISLYWHVSFFQINLPLQLITITPFTYEFLFFSLFRCFFFFTDVGSKQFVTFILLRLKYLQFKIDLC